MLQKDYTDYNIKYLMTQDLVVISFERDIPLLNVFVKSVDKKNFKIQKKL